MAKAVIGRLFRPGSQQAPGVRSRSVLMETRVHPNPAAFFVTGGTLPPDAVSYVDRLADRELLAALLAGEYCYVLNARQMGKSSLCVRTIARLKDAGVRTAFIDLTRFGTSNLTADQWYAALVSELGRELGLRAEMLRCYKEHSDLPPVQRLFAALEEVALPAASHEAPGSAPSLVLFIDEIDVTRSLPFDTDEFFAAIRQCFVGRATDPPLQRLGFCLLGTATPSDLVRDIRITPFNIGRRVEVQDFTPEEAAPLGRGLGDSGPALLERVLYWTGGHPYLTQRLCRAASESPAKTPADIDRLCASLFLSHTAKDADDNLALVRSRLLQSGVDVSALLALYGKVRAGKRIQDDETSPIVDVLKLSGVVRVADGLLRPRNRIYSRVFDEEWIASHMPDAELRRQREAYRKGLLRATSLAALIVALSGGLAVYALAQKANADRLRVLADQRAARNAQLASANAVLADARARALQEAHRSAAAYQDSALKNAKLAGDNASLAAARERALEASQQNQRRAKAAARLAEENAQRARESARQAEQETGIASRQAAAARSAEAKARAAAGLAARNLYVADMGLIQRDWDNNNVGHVVELLAQTRNDPDRGFEWGYWNRLCHLDLLTLRGHTSTVESVYYSPDGQQILSGSRDGTAKVWDAGTGKVLSTFNGHTGTVFSACYSPDGQRIVTAGGDARGSASVWDVHTRQKLLTLQDAAGAEGLFLYCACYSPDGKRIITGGQVNHHGAAWVWDARTGQELHALTGDTQAIMTVSFSLDGQRIATGGWDRVAEVWDAASGRKLLTLTGHTGTVRSVRFSPDGRRIVTASDDKTAKLWDASTARELRTFSGHTGPVYSACFSPDGQRIVSGSQDQTVRVWDASTGDELLTFKGHAGPVTSACYSPGGQRILTGSVDHTAKLWDARGDKERLTLAGHTGGIGSVSFSPDGQHILTGSSDDTARVWDASTGRELRTLIDQTGFVTLAAYSPDGQRIVTAGFGDVASVWDARTGERLQAFKDNAAGIARFSPDGNRVFLGGNGRTATVRDATNGKILVSLNGVDDVFAEAQFSPDGRRIVTRGWGNTAKIWDASTGRELLELFPLKGHIAVIQVFAVCYSPDGKRIVTGNNEGTATVFDASTGNVLLILRGHIGPVYSACFSPDGRRILTGSADDTAKLWDSSTGQELLTLEGHTGAVGSARFSPDGKRIVTGSEDKTAIVWFSSDQAGSP